MPKSEDLPRTIPELYRTLERRFDRLEKRLDRVEDRMDRLETGLVELKANAGTLALAVGNAIQILNGRINEEVAEAVKRLNV